MTVPVNCPLTGVNVMDVALGVRYHHSNPMSRVDPGSDKIPGAASPSQHADNLPGTLPV